MPNPPGPGQTKDFYFYDHIYTSLGYQLTGDTAVLSDKPNPFAGGKRPSWAKVTTSHSMPTDPKLQARMDRGNEMFKALEKESDRGKACLADSLLGEPMKEPFAERLMKAKESTEILADGQALGNHVLRWKLAYCDLLLREFASLHRSTSSHPRH